MWDGWDMSLKQPAINLFPGSATCPTLHAARGDGWDARMCWRRQRADCPTCPLPADFEWDTAGFRETGGFLRLRRACPLCPTRPTRNNAMSPRA